MMVWRWWALAVVGMAAAPAAGSSCTIAPAHTIVKCPSNTSLPCTAYCTPGYLFAGNLLSTAATCPGNTTVWSVALPCRVDGCNHAQCFCGYCVNDGFDGATTPSTLERITLDPTAQPTTTTPPTSTTTVPTSDMITGEVNYLGICIACIPPLNCSTVPPLDVIPLFPAKICSIYLKDIRLQNNFAGLVSYAKLSTLLLSNANLTRLDAFPNVELPKLTSLVLANNQITIVAPNYFFHPSLKLLKLLDLSGNFITEFPSQAFSQLNYVCCYL
jgi:hypothetical protein